jgi:hypothetical protein
MDGYAGDYLVVSDFLMFMNNNNFVTIRDTVFSFPFTTIYLCEGLYMEVFLRRWSKVTTNLLKIKKYFCGQWCSNFCLCAVTFGLENLATFSLAVNSVPYFNGIMHYELEDAANMLTNYMGVSYILAILVAVVADTWVGRYKSVIFSGFFEFLVSSRNSLSIPLQHIV